jgi:hypothetical protein
MANMHILDMPKHRIERENKYILNKNKNIIINGILSCRTVLQVESSISFARYLCHCGLTRSNYRLFIRVLETNNKWVIDALIGKRDPSLLFASIRPTTFLVKKALGIISFWHPKQLYPKVLHALLGVLEYAFHKPDEGYRIFQLRMADLNNIGKYLDEEKNQDDPDNRHVLDILDRITRIGEYRRNIYKNNLSKHAFRIRHAFFDDTKKLRDIIPQVLLVSLQREDGETKPSEGFLKFMETAE